MRKLTPILFGLLIASTAHATSHRTYVAASGTDSGTCTPTAPCRSLAYALTQTNSAGEIIITQSGGYGDATGGLVIDKSISIIAEPGVFAALAPTTGNGITIATAGIDVALKGLSINGRGGTYGINMTNGASLDLDRVSISNFSGGFGLLVTTLARITVKHATFRNVQYGIVVGYAANLLVSQSQLTDIVYEGIRISGGTSGTTTVTATDTLVRCKIATYGYGFDNLAATGTVGKMYLDRVTASNCYVGVVNEPNTAGASNVVSLSNSVVTGNGYGIYNLSTSTFLSSGNNHVTGNGTDTSGTITTGSLLH